MVSFYLTIMRFSEDSDPLNKDNIEQYVVSLNYHLTKTVDMKNKISIDIMNSDI